MNSSVISAIASSQIGITKEEFDRHIGSIDSRVSVLETNDYIRISDGMNPSQVGYNSLKDIANANAAAATHASVMGYAEHHIDTSDLDKIVKMKVSLASFIDSSHKLVAFMDAQMIRESIRELRKEITALKASAGISELDIIQYMEDSINEQFYREEDSLPF